jgi:hypothetical protein
MKSSIDKKLDRQSMNFLLCLILKRASYEIGMSVPAMIAPLLLPINHLAALAFPQLLIQGVCIDAETIGSSCYPDDHMRKMRLIRHETETAKDP